MPPVILLPVVGLAALLAYRKYKGHPLDALTAAIRDTVSPPGAPAVVAPVVTPGSQAAVTPVMPSTPRSTVPGAPPALVLNVGSTVTTPATVVEPSQSLPVIAPNKQPRMPSQQQVNSLTLLAPQLQALLLSNPLREDYIVKNPTLTGMVRQFQTTAELEVDGKYGPQTAGVLAYYLGQPPAPPMFYGVGPRAIKTYRPGT